MLSRHETRCTSSLGLAPRLSYEVSFVPLKIIVVSTTIMSSTDVCRQMGKLTLLPEHDSDEASYFDLSHLKTRHLADALPSGHEHRYENPEIVETTTFKGLRIVTKIVSSDAYSVAR